MGPIWNVRWTQWWLCLKIFKLKSFILDKMLKAYNNYTFILKKVKTLKACEKRIANKLIIKFKIK